MPRSDVIARILVPLAAVLIIGCGNNHSRELDQATQTLSSWATSLDFAEMQFRGGSVPRLYLRQLLQAANESLDSHAKSIAKAPTDDPRRRDLENKLQSLRHRIGEISGGLAS